MMKERPILMTPENAQKCHEGVKTQTRRIVKPQPLRMSWFEHQQGWCARVREDTGSAEHPAYVMVPCPYGVVGDRLWVRETTALWREGWDRTNHVVYRGGMVDKEGNDFSQPDLMGLGKWRPSLHMPRWACRTVLEITEIRVERLQEISEEDARAEGIQEVGIGAVHDFMILWESINGKGSWELNPWVWVLAFKKVGGEIAGRVRVIE